MKSYLRSLRSLFIPGLLAAVLGAVAHAAEVGQAAPAFSLTDLTGQSYQLDDFKGKTLVLEWVNPECPFVVKHYDASGNLPALQQAAVADGVVWLLINSGAKGKQGDLDDAAVKAWMEKNKVAATAYLRDQDGVVGKAYAAKTTPHMYVINAEGTLVYAGAIDSVRSTKAADIAGAENYVKAALAAVKAGTPVATASTQPYGCSVKY
jgi:hypothetical protein